MYSRHRTVTQDTLWTSFKIKQEIQTRIFYPLLWKEGTNIKNINYKFRTLKENAHTETITDTHMEHK